jgi:hypothetical protein
MEWVYGIVLGLENQEKQKQKGQAIKQIVLLTSATSLWKRIESAPTSDGDVL